MMENGAYIKQPNYLIIGFVILQLVFFVIIGVVVANVFTNDDVTFDSSARPIASVSGLPSFFTDDDLFTISSSLHSLMLRNNGEGVFLDDDAVAFVNEDSETFFHFNDKEFTLFSAVIEAPNIGQSYKMLYGFPDEKNNSFQEFIEFICLKSPTSSCISSSDATEEDYVREFIRYLSFNGFTAYVNDKNPQEIIISTIKPFDGDKNVEMSYTDEVKTAIEAMGFSSDAFTYRVYAPEDYTYEIVD